MSWITLGDPKKDMLKVLCQYLYFWLSYKHMSRLSQNVTHTQTDRHTDRHLANLYKMTSNRMLFPFIFLVSPGLGDKSSLFLSSETLIRLSIGSLITIIYCTALAQQMRFWQGVFYNSSPLYSTPRIPRKHLIPTTLIT